MSSHSRSSSYATSRLSLSTSQRPSSQKSEQRQLSTGSPLPGASPVHVSHKRRNDHGSPEDVKRRRQDTSSFATDELLKPSIVVRAQPSNPLSRPYTLFPIMLLPREHLPLSYLDLAAPSGDLPSSRRFQSHIRILDLEGRLGSNVLLARSPSSKSGSSGSGFSSASSVFAIERDESGFYTLCKLGSWVDLETLSQHATAVCQQRMLAKPTVPATSTRQVHALVTPRTYKEQGKKRLVIAELQSIVRRRPAATQLTPEATVGSQADTDLGACDDLLVPFLDAVEEATGSFQAVDETQERSDDLPAQPSSQTVLQVAPVIAKSTSMPTPPASDATKQSSMEPSDTAATLNLPEPPGPPTADDIFQNIRSQYFEALYHSLGSLAYFAKGPLSRARAAFHLDCDSILDMNDLIDFLKSITLASTTIDKKYRETIPELVSHLRTLGDVVDHAETKRKSKKPKKMKLGSSGLYTDEDVHVRKWWAANKPITRTDEILPRPEDVRYTISCLRTRETQLQMILILEIMALETMRHGIDAGESQLPGMAVELLDTPYKKAAPKKRNKLNLPLLIDVHADRLCIWQSTTTDEFRAQAESQILPASEPSTVQTAQADPLKEFCVDIILPFFSPRLPLVCDSLNRKLGGPVISAAGSRSKHVSSSTKLASNAKFHEKLSSLSAKSGAAKKRSSASTDKTRSLERVLSNERLRRSVSRGPNDAIAQMRCATAAAIPGLKREPSDTSLASIPRRASSISTRDGSAKPLSRSASEIIDSSGRTDQSHAARKKALVDAELQDAIDALKKPNRVLAGRATAEAAERRLFGVTVKKPKKQPSRPSPGTTVQVQATPTSNRVQDIFATTTVSSFESQSAGQQLGRDPYRFPVKRELLATGRGQQQPGLSPSSPMIMSTPLNGRVQATPAHTATSLAGFAATQLLETFSTASSTATATKTNTTRFTQPFSGGEESVPMSSPVAVRRTAPLFSLSSGVGARPCQRLNVIAATELGNDMVPASSPLQARSQPSASRADSRRQAPLSTLAQPPSPFLTRAFDRRAAMFETPTKSRPVSREDTVIMKREIGTPIAATPLAAHPAAGTLSSSRGGNSVLSLYQKMGWDDDLDELD